LHFNAIQLSKLAEAPPASNQAAKPVASPKDNAQLVRVTRRKMRAPKN